MENHSITLRPEKILFQEDSVKITDRNAAKYRIRFSQIVWAYIECRALRSGRETVPQRPVLEEITEETDGILVLLDRWRRRWILQTDRAGRTAGEVLTELGMRAPYLLLGGQAWLDETAPEDFEEAVRMVELMRPSAES